MIEDMGYFCVGNLPISLVESVVQLAENDPELDKVAINVDVRSGQNIGDLNAILDRLEEQGKSFEMLSLNVTIPLSSSATRRLGAFILWRRANGWTRGLLWSACSWSRSSAGRTT